MIQLNHGYTIFFTVEVAGVATAADSTPTAVLYRDGSASGVTVTVEATATTGLYKATFTSDAGWANTDVLHLVASAAIASTSGYIGVVWDSTGDVDAVMRGTDGANTIAPDNAGIAANGVAIDNVPSAAEIAEAIGAGDGDRVVVITVRNDASEVVPNAKVTIQTAAGATIAGRTLNTNSSGVAQFNLDDGSYKGLVTTTSGYETHTAQAFTVDEDEEPVTLTITRTTISDPPDAGVCRLAAYVFWNDEPVSGATVSARLKGINQGTDGKLMSRVAKEATTNSSGLATLDLIQGGEFVDGDGVYVIEAVHNRNVIWQIESAMPDEAQANVEDLIS